MTTVRLTRAVSANPSLKGLKVALKRPVASLRAVHRKAGSWIGDHKWWVVGGLTAVAVGGAVLYFATKPGAQGCQYGCAPGQPCQPGCGSNQNCYSFGDFPAQSDGSCAAGSAPDPNHPGCCMSTCGTDGQGHCSQGSDCSGCGYSPYGCYQGTCYAPDVTKAHLSPTVAALSTSANVNWQMTSCWYGPACEPVGPCNLSTQLNPTRVYQPFVVIDQNGQPMAGVPINAQWASGYPYSNDVNIRYDPVTNAQGTFNVYATLVGLPSPATDPGNYKCGSVCPNGQGCSGNFLWGTLAQVNFSAAGQLLPASLLSINLQIYWKITVNNGLSGCACL